MEDTSKSVDGWRVFYTEGRVFSSAETEWGELPDDGVLVMVLYLDQYSGGGEVQHRLVLDGSDWYFHVPGTDLYGSNNDDPKEIEDRYPGAIIKRGKWAPHGEFRAVKNRAWEAGCP